MSNLKEFLAVMEQQVEDIVNVYVPSIGKNIKFKHITVKQQKEIIKGTLNGIKGNMLLTKTFNNIVTGNCLEDVEFLITDRNAVLVQLRIASLGTPVTDEDGKKTDLAIDTIKSNIKEYEPLYTGEVEHIGIIVQLEVPTLSKDNKYYDLLDQNSYDNAGDVVNDLYASEIAKFITHVTIGDTVVTPIPKDSLVIIEKLPLALNRKVVEFIKQAKNFDALSLKTVSGSNVILDAKFFNTPED